MQTHIKPGQIWLDTKGARIQAHGAGIYYENGYYYWYGGFAFRQFNFTINW
ncbi:hypothetical protein [Anaerobium acetethylicum]|uniref:Uncharacterized protein n=1 Tax=Anaerobium acetethylicum TaxID=1619234 RepID=A0A1D3TX40_9FIRM|nr:hypothetical protein [Anaerobium acetethylicum]SCP98848.1 hypothetical protein SAMN05421730_102723 [Anaerobium acetethylicum]